MLQSRNMWKPLCGTLLLVILVSVQAFAPFSRTRTTCTRAFARKKDVDAEFVAKLEQIGKSDMQYFFTGGAFDNMDAQAAQIASRITGVKSLGWTLPAKRRGGARPRHRAYGGQTEKPVQLKPNYDESSPICVEKWLTQEEFYDCVRDSSPAADTVFVALAGGAAFAERDAVEKKLAEWRSGGKFDEAAFLKSVQQGRFELGFGWAVFFSLNAIIVSCLLVPTNPLAQALENAVGQLKDILRPPEML